jgi:hypothetical protein
MCDQTATVDELWKALIEQALRQTKEQMTYWREENPEGYEGEEPEEFEATAKEYAEDWLRSAFETKLAEHLYGEKESSR